MTTLQILFSDQGGKFLCIDLGMNFEQFSFCTK